MSRFSREQRRHLSREDSMSMPELLLTGVGLIGTPRG
jgi:hypothetical protein